MKTGIVENAVRKETNDSSISDIENACPSVSRIMIKKILARMQEDKKIKSLGKGQGAKWRRMVY